MSTDILQKLMNKWKINDLENQDLEMKSFMAIVESDMPPMNLPKELLEMWLAIGEVRERFHRLVIHESKLFIKVLDVLEEMTYLLDPEMQKQIIKLLVPLNIDHTLIEQQSSEISEKLRQIVIDSHSQYS